MTKVVLRYKMPVYVTVDLTHGKVLTVECSEADIEPHREGEVLRTDGAPGDEARRAAAIADDAPWPRVRLTREENASGSGNATGTPTVPVDFRTRPVIKPGIAATRFYLVVAESDGDVAAYAIAPPQAQRTGQIAVENNGEGAANIWNAASDALAHVMPDDDAEWQALDEAARRQIVPVGR